MEEALPGESASSGALLEGVAPVWERMGAAERARYEREHGIKPPGYRATGEVDWFARFHAESAPCCTCGAVTDRWVVGFARVATVAWGHPHVDQPMGPAEQRDKKLAVVWEAVWPFCASCERRAAIAVLERRQANAAIGEEVKAHEAAYLAELVAEESGITAVD